MNSDCRDSTQQSPNFSMRLLIGHEANSMNSSSTPRSSILPNWTSPILSSGFSCSVEMSKLLKGTRAKALASATSLPEVHLSSSIAEALRMLESDFDVFFVRGYANTSPHVPGGQEALSQSGTGANRAADVIFTRKSLFRNALESNSTQQPLSSILSRMDPVKDFVNGNHTLDLVVNLMIASGGEEVGVIDQGVVRGIITAKRLITFIRHQEQIVHGQSAMKDARRRNSTYSQESREHGQDASVRTPRASSAQVNPIFSSGRAAMFSPHQNLTFIQSRSHTTSPDAITLGAAGHHRAESIASDDSSAHFDLQNERHSDKYGRLRFHEAQLEAQHFCSSWCCELLMLICLVLCTVMGIANFVDDQDSAETQDRLILGQGCCLFIFFYERAVRGYGFFQRMRNHPGWLVDSFIVDVSVIIYILVLTDTINAEYKLAVTILQALRLIRVFCSRRFGLVRRAVSSEKTRYTEDGFDLDLTYITKSCIAMSLPALGAEASYRNPLLEVQRFFAAKHEGHFWIFNLCKERNYDPELFDGRVDRIEVEDHNPPRLHQIVAFVERAGEFMEEDPENCIAVHCKGGKGRTGVMICAWLMYSKQCATAASAMEMFSKARTSARARSSQGVTQPSQRRYVEYMEGVLLKGGYYSPQIELRSIIVKTCPRMSKEGGCTPWLTIEEDGRLIYDYRNYNLEFDKMSGSETQREFQVDVNVQGDIRIVFYHRDGNFSSFSTGDVLLCFFCFHTNCVTSKQTRFGKSEIDMAHSDGGCKVFQESFAVELNFRSQPNENEPTAFRKIIQPSTAFSRQRCSDELGRVSPTAPSMQNTTKTVGRSSSARSPFRAQPSTDIPAVVPPLPSASATQARLGMQAVGFSPRSFEPTSPYLYERPTATELRTSFSARSPASMDEPEAVEA